MGASNIYSITVYIKVLILINFNRLVNISWYRRQNVVFTELGSFCISLSIDFDVY